MELYERWCESTKEKNKRKYYWTYVEKDGGRDDICEDLAETISTRRDSSGHVPSRQRTCNSLACY